MRKNFNFAKTKSFKTVLTVLCVFTLAVFCMPLAAHADATSGTCGDTNVNSGANVTWSYDNAHTTLTITGIGAMADYAKINSPWNTYASIITAVTINSGVTTIGNYAFQNCTSLTSITIQSSVQTIGDNAFNSCGLTSITIPSGVQTIGNYAFNGCTNLKTVTFDETSTCTTIGLGAFYGCTGLESITLPSGVTTIGESAFDGCTGLKSITLPSSLMGNANLPDLSSMTTVNVTGSDWSFDSSTGTLTIQSATKVTTNYDSNTNPAPWYSIRAKITTVTLPNTGVTAIGNYAFQNCTSLESITLPSGVTTIGESAFDGCTGLERITLPYSTQANIQFIGINTDNCTVTYTGTLTTSGTCGTKVNWKLVSNEPQGNTYTLNITGTGAMASYDPIGMMGGQTSYAPWSIVAQKITAVTIENGVTAIGAFTFPLCTSLTSISIPSSVQTIGLGAFYGCTGLESITLPSGVTTIGDSAFDGCTGLKRITLPYSTQAYILLIGIDTDKCTVTYTGTLTTIGNCGTDVRWKLVSNEPQENTYTLNITGTGAMASYDPIGIMGSQTSYAPWSIVAQKITAVTIENNVKAIGAFTFPLCTSLTSISIPSGVQTIGLGAFYGCTDLESITLPSGVTTIGDSAFYGCTGLKSITLPSDVTAIGNYAFYDCTSLTRITIQSGVQTIGTMAFNGCTSLESITLPSGVTTIGESAFNYCRSLKSITLPNTVTTIGNYAFNCCQNLTDITLPSSLMGNANLPDLSSMTTVNVTGSDWSFENSTGTLTIQSATKVTTNYDSNTKPAPWYSIRAKITTVTLPNTGVTAIGNYAFQNCTSLTSITLPNSVETIGTRAFADCSSLATINIPSGFDKTKFSDSCVTVGTGNAYTIECISDKNINGAFVEQAAGSGTEIFVVSNDNTKLDVSSGTTTIDTSSLTNWSTVKTTITTVAIAEGATSIADNAFKDCSNLTSITIPKTVTTIGARAFENCANLANITIPSSVPSVTVAQFAGCTNLQTITIEKK